MKTIKIENKEYEIVEIGLKYTDLVVRKIKGKKWFAGNYRADKKDKAIFRVEGRSVCGDLLGVK